MNCLFSHGNYLRPELMTHFSIENVHLLLPITCNHYPTWTIYIKRTVRCSSNHADSVNVNQELNEVLFLSINNQSIMFFFLSAENQGWTGTYPFSLLLYADLFFFLSYTGGWSPLKYPGFIWSPLLGPNCIKPYKQTLKVFQGLLKTLRAKAFFGTSLLPEVPSSTLFRNLNVSSFHASSAMHDKRLSDIFA